jgi:DNA polymerase I
VPEGLVEQGALDIALPGPATLSAAADGDADVLMVVDGHSLAYRALHAMPDTLLSTSGAPVGAVHGFATMLTRLIVARRPARVAVTFDVGRDVWRMALNPAYKATRRPAPPSFADQLDVIRSLLPALSVQLVEVADVEADDVIATLAAEAVAEGMRVEVVTGDRDALQLVSDRVTVLLPVKGVGSMAEMTPLAVAEKTGVAPTLYVQLAALRGDTSDNLPGVPGVGVKTAASLLTRFGSLTELFAHLDEVPGQKVRAALAQHQALVELNVTMMTLRRDIPLPVRVADLPAPTVDLAKLRRWGDWAGVPTVAARVAGMFADDPAAPF